MVAAMNMALPSVLEGCCLPQQPQEGTCTGCQAWPCLRWQVVREPRLALSASLQETGDTPKLGSFEEG